MPCTLGADNVFGPVVGQGCRDDFDFTLLFEQSFFQILPSALFLLLIPLRAFQLRYRTVKVLKNGSRLIKQLAILVLAGTQLTLLIVWSITPMFQTKTALPAAIVSFVASLCLYYLSSIEHARSIRPSSLINAFLLLSLLLDIPQARTLWLRQGPRYLPGVFTAGMATKTIILYLEARNKRAWLFPEYRLNTPEALVSLYDRTLLWWLNPTFWRGYRSFLPADTLDMIDSELAGENVERTFLAIWKSQDKTKRWALLWAVVLTIKYQLLWMIPPRLCLTALQLSQPLLIARITVLLGNGVTKDNIDSARGLIGASALVFTGIAITTAMYERALNRLAIQAGGVIVTSVHSKIFTLQSSKLADKTALSLISADLKRVTNSLKVLDALLATPIEVILAIFLLEREIGLSCIAPAALALAVSVLGLFNANNAMPLQKTWLAAVSKRISFTATVLGFPKSLKMLGLTDYLSTQIQAMRVDELAEYAHYRKYTVWRNIFSHIPQNFAPALTLMMFTLIQGEKALNPSTAFSTLALISLVSNPIQQLISALPSFQNSLASLQRVQTFLLLEGDDLDQRDEPEPQWSLGIARAEDDHNAVTFELPRRDTETEPHDVPFDFRLRKGCVVLGSDKKQILHDIDLELQTSNLNIIIGPVGSGKSVLLKTLIGEHKLASGSLRIGGCGNGIAFCAQDPWIPNSTVRSIILAQSDMDPKWYETVISACGLTTDLDTFDRGDATLVGTKGVSLSGGQRQRLSLARALYARRRFLVADDVLSGLDSRTSRHVFNRVFGQHGLCRSYGITVVLATHAHQYLAEAGHVVVLRNGAIAEQGTFHDLLNNGVYIKNRVYYTDSERQTDVTEDPVLVSAAKSPAIDNVALAQQDLARKLGDRSVYAYYLKSIGWKFGSILAITVVSFAFGQQFPSLWVRWWSQASTSDNSRPLAYWIGIAILIACLATVSSGANIWTMLVYAVPKSSAHLHKQLLDAVMRAKYCFFVNTDSGAILNRFATDMSLIETELASAMMRFTNGAAILLFSAGLIVAGADYAAVALPPVCVVLYVIQRFYLRTSRQLRFLQLEALAPLLAHCSETIAGVTTIRAFGWQHQTRENCLRLLDRSQQAQYLLLCIQRWLTLVLNLVTAAVAVVVVTLAIELPNTSSAGSIGVSLLGIMNFSSLLTIVVSAWTALETSLGAVARCKNFESSTPTEDKPEETFVPPPEWPLAGSVVLKDVTASYNEDEQNVLKSVTLSIKAGEKIGVCGRTGSGKSSLLLTLFRLLDYSTGSIEIDGIDLSTVPRQLIRSRLSALPQESIIFTGSLRTNIDPEERYTVEEIETALRKVNLLETIAGGGGINAEIGAFNLSHGQMQLFAVARTLLWKSKILVLDEMTSSVDPDTEQTMVRLIKEEFAESTVIAVAHRLKTIVSFDRIVVMDAGRLVETGTPEELLSLENGLFRKMWEGSEK